MSKSTEKGVSEPKGLHDHWEIRDAMHTMLRAHKIVKDKPLMSAVRKEAKKHAAELHETASHADALAKRGMISDKQMAKLGAR